MKIFLAVITVLALISSSSAITYNRCSLVRAMRNIGVPFDQLARWACIAERESSYRTFVVGPPNSDGSRDYGIFQINDRYWCQPPSGRFSSNGCRINCNALLGDDIRPSMNCVQQILRQQGWGAWSVWRFCSGNLPSVNNCF
ncbi:lysozyme B-like [Lucilia sericata]|uniref:lysozyme B-like n=1 Tax=Lucilia sericata TaxID=13632 RepID=UPI0018A82B6B|nr:lysozyme B-like [Lucilia sericata]